MKRQLYRAGILFTVAVLAMTVFLFSLAQKRLMMLAAGFGSFVFALYPGHAASLAKGDFSKTAVILYFLTAAAAGALQHHGLEPGGRPRGPDHAQHRLARRRAGYAGRNATAGAR